jgi:hypothetical protein
MWWHARSAGTLASDERASPVMESREGFVFGSPSYTTTGWRIER